MMRADEQTAGQNSLWIVLHTDNMGRFVLWYNLIILTEHVLAEAALSDERQGISLSKVGG